LNYNNLDKHIKYVYDDIIIKYKNIDKYKFIPIGWSAGGYLALYFSQIYYKKCKI
jgi:predicted peptidase